MELQDFLKVKKVRYVDGDNYKGLTYGEIYEVIGATHSRVKVKNDEGVDGWFDSHHFEPVLDESKSQDKIDTSANSVDNLADNADIKDTPKFKVGDPVYHEINGDIYTIMAIENGAADLSVLGTYQKRTSVRYLCHATQENYERLKATFPDIEFEAPPKDLTGSDLARALIKKGWCGFNCVCGNSGDDNVMITTIVTGINGSGQFIDIDGRLFNNAKPMLGSYPLKAEQAGL